jgi:hypothetical protein
MRRIQAEKDVSTGIGLGAELDKKGSQKIVDTLLSVIPKVAIEINH